MSQLCRAPSWTSRVHFMSAMQLPRDKIASNGIRGDAERLDSQPGAHNILVSLKIRDFLRRAGMAYSAASLWKWVALVPGLDITALLYGDEVIGAALGFYSATEHTYLTHVTAVHRDLRSGAGVGLFLRQQQLRLLVQRICAAGGPVEVVSLSANADGHNRGAVGFQRNVLEQLEFQELSGAMPVIERISEANPGLELERVLR